MKYTNSDLNLYKISPPQDILEYRGRSSQVKTAKKSHNPGSPYCVGFILQSRFFVEMESKGGQNT